MTDLSIEQQITFLRTGDLPATAHFYEQVLGLELAVDQGDCRIYRVNATSYIGFCQRSTTPEVPQGVILTLVTQDVDAWYDLLCARDVAFEHPPVENAKYAIYHCFLRDPNGYLIEIQRFLHPFGQAAN